LNINGSRRALNMRGRKRSGVRSSSCLNNNGNTNQEGEKGMGNRREWKEKGEE
jgi:hypothetical protein